jgi:hypothetical protein
VKTFETHRHADSCSNRFIDPLSSRVAASRAVGASEWRGADAVACS